MIRLKGYSDGILRYRRWIVLSGAHFFAQMLLFIPVSMLTIEGTGAFPALKRFSF